jgi:hypothetical protein
MSEPFARPAPDPAAEVHAQIERLKATEERLASLVSAGRAGSDDPAMITTTSTPDVEAAEAAPRASRLRWRRPAG